MNPEQLNAICRRLAGSGQQLSEDVVQKLLARDEATILKIMREVRPSPMPPVLATRLRR